MASIFCVIPTIMQFKFQETLVRCNTHYTTFCNHKIILQIIVSFIDNHVMNGAVIFIFFANLYYIALNFIIKNSLSYVKGWFLSVGTSV